MSAAPIEILLVEDNPGDARLLREALAEGRSDRFQVAHVDRLADAVKRLNEEEWGLVLLDLSLPDAHGLDTVTRVHAQAPHVPIIVLTGLDDEALAVSALREGAQDYLVKGRVDGPLLVRAMRYAIERKRAEEAVRESEERYRLLFNSASDAVFVHALTEDGLPDRFVEVNDVACRTLGYTREELLRLSPSDLDPPEAASWVSEKRQGLHARGAFLMETEHLTKDGKRVPVELSARLFQLKGKGMVLATSRDITERKRAEEENRILQEQLAQAQKMEALGTLAGGIAHEFNNINAVIMGYIDLTLQNDGLPQPVRRNLKIVQASAVRGGDLTRSLLAFSRKNVGQKRPVNLRDVVDEVLRVTANEFTSEGIEVIAGHSAGIPHVMGDFSLITQVIINLVINARHAMLQTAVRKLTVETGVEKGRPFVRVKDTGCGIAESDIRRVFEPFFTTKGSLASGKAFDGKARGTGLGLSVCHSVVQAHGGEIRVNSEINQGTIFTVYFPPSSEGESPSGKEARTRKKGARHVMVVDDEKDISNLLVQVLDHAGYTADGFTSAKEALRALRRDKYALAFIDLQMPDMNGLDFMRALDTLPQTSKPLKVILTGRLDHSAEEYDHLDVFATVQKPFTSQQILSVVEKGLGARANSAGQRGEEPSSKQLTSSSASKPRI